MNINPKKVIEDTDNFIRWVKSKELKSTKPSSDDDMINLGYFTTNTKSKIQVVLLYSTEDLLPFVYNDDKDGVVLVLYGTGSSWNDVRNSAISDKYVLVHEMVHCHQRVPVDFKQGNPEDLKSYLNSPLEKEALSIEYAYRFMLESKTNSSPKSYEELICTICGTEKVPDKYKKLSSPLKDSLLDEVVYILKILYKG